MNSFDDEQLVRAYFGGVSGGDYFPRGRRVGIYIPDWDSEFVVTPDGRSFMSGFPGWVAKVLSLMSVKGRAVRVLRLVDEGSSMHEMSDLFPVWFDFTCVVTWLLQRGYIIRVLDRSV